MYKITQKTTPNKWVGRDGHQPIAIVNHRMVGYLPGTDAHFANDATDVSAHFGIGYRTDGGPVEISQYVDLSDTAWTAGNYQSSGGWPLVKRNADGSVINPNRYIIGIEHEDGGPNDGRVSQPVLDASLWLTTILLTGDIDLMRFVGIKIRLQSTATALKNIVEGKETLIDHNRISGNLKPYCWQPYKLDTKAWPDWQPKLLEQLRGSKMAIEDTLALLDQQVAELIADKNQAVADKNVAETALALETAKVTTAKQKAANIKVLADDIINL